MEVLTVWKSPAMCDYELKIRKSERKYARGGQDKAYTRF